MVIFTSAPVRNTEGVPRIQLLHGDPVPVGLCESWVCSRMHGAPRQLLAKGFPKYASTTIARTTFIVLIHCLANYFGRPDLWEPLTSSIIKAGARQPGPASWAPIFKNPRGKPMMACFDVKRNVNST